MNGIFPGTVFSGVGAGYGQYPVHAQPSYGYPQSYAQPTFAQPTYAPAQPTYAPATRAQAQPTRAPAQPKRVGATPTYAQPSAQTYLAPADAQVQAPAFAPTRRGQAQVTPKLATAEERTAALEAAAESVQRLTKAAISELKSFAKPPMLVKLTMEAICIMLQIKPVTEADPNVPRKKVESYWKAAKKLLANPTSFLSMLVKYDRDSIPDAVIAKVRPYIGREDFNPVAVGKVSRACMALCGWTRGMFFYHGVAKGIEPMRQKDSQAERLAKLQVERLAKLQAGREAALTRKAALQASAPATTEERTAALEAAFEAAAESLDSLTKRDLRELKSFVKPPMLVKLTMEAICIMLQIKPVTEADPNDPRKKVESYWPAAKKLLADPASFLSMLVKYDRDSIPDAVIAKVRPYIEREDFTERLVKRSAPGCAGLCVWIRGMYTYHGVAKSIASMRG